MREKIETIADYRTPEMIAEGCPPPLPPYDNEALGAAICDAVCIPAHWLPPHVIKGLKHGRKNRGSYSLAEINAYCDRAPKAPPVDMDKLTTTANVKVYEQSTDEDGEYLTDIPYDVDEYRLKCSQLAFGKLLASWAGKSLADYIEE